MTCIKSIVDYKYMLIFNYWTFVVSATVSSENNCYTKKGISVRKCVFIGSFLLRPEFTHILHHWLLSLTGLFSHGTIWRMTRFPGSLSLVGGLNMNDILALPQRDFEASLTSQRTEF